MVEDAQGWYNRLVHLPPYRFVDSHSSWQECLARLRDEPRLAIDLEANSLYAYQEQVCLVQLSIAGQDYVVDPTAGLDLSGLGRLIEDPAVEKVLHAAEYDLILLKREFGWIMQSLFDTMWAARILGYQKVGLANILEDLYGVRQNKKHQKANWCRRPLTQSQLAYAQMDAHFLLPLRAHLLAELKAAGRLEEAREIFAEQCRIHPGPNGFDPDSFWSINGVNELSGRQRAVLKALSIYRDEQARRQNRPHFKVFGDQTLLELAQAAPKYPEELPGIFGMSPGQIGRYGRHILRVIRQAEQEPQPNRPANNHSRPPQAVVERFERLHAWRRERAQARGVESDVILSREAMWALARVNPKTTADLSRVGVLGPWRLATYGDEIVRVLHGRRK